MIVEEGANPQYTDGNLCAPLYYTDGLNLHIDPPLNMYNDVIYTCVLLTLNPRCVPLKIRLSFFYNVDH